jgi:hypothetical protein
MEDIIDKIYEQVINEACVNPLRRFAELIRQDEREACAKLCEDLFMSDGDYCAKAIRGRTEPKSDFKTQMDDNWAGLI